MTMRRISLRTVVIDIPPQDVITRDNVTLKVNAVLQMHVSNPEFSVVKIENYLYATSQLAQTTLRAVLGEVELDELLADREKINGILKRIIDEHTDPWGIQVTQVARGMAQEPGAMQLRYLQTVTEIAAENNSTTIFPLPMELLTPFLAGRKGTESLVPVLPGVKPEFSLPQISRAATPEPK